MGVEALLLKRIFETIFKYLRKLKVCFTAIKSRIVEKGMG